MNTCDTYDGDIEQGFSLIELLVALTIGAVISTTAIAMYGQLATSFRQDDLYREMQENGRTALTALANDLAMADFWGQIVASDNISTSLVTAVGGCEAAVTLFTAEQSILINNYHASPAYTQFNLCESIANVLQPSTDVLVIKRVAGTPIAKTFIDTADVDGDSDVTETITMGATDLDAGKVYLRSNGNTGTLINTASSSSIPATGESDWAYRPKIYFIRTFYDTDGDGDPALCRLALDSASNFEDAECIARGIEHFHVQFGIDTDGDGFANLYTASPNVAELDSAVTARLHIITRTDEPVPFHTDNRIYRLGDVTLAAKNDGFMRQLSATTVIIRNTLNRSLL